MTTHTHTHTLVRNNIVNYNVPGTVVDSNGMWMRKVVPPPVALFSLARALCVLCRKCQQRQARRLAKRSFTFQWGALPVPFTLFTTSGIDHRVQQNRCSGWQPATIERNVTDNLFSCATHTSRAPSTKIARRRQTLRVRDVILKLIIQLLSYNPCRRLEVSSIHLESQSVHASRWLDLLNRWVGSGVPISCGAGRS